MDSDKQSQVMIIDPFKDLSWIQMQNGLFTLQSQKINSELSIKKTSFLTQAKDKNVKDIKKEKDKEKKVYDNTVKFKVDQMVLTEWGIGKITAVLSQSKSCKVKIEGDEVQFGYDFINPYILIFFCVLTKTKTEWLQLKFNMADTVENVKRKLASIYLCHYSQILLVHTGEKLTNNKEKLFELGLFEGDEMLSVVKDPQEYFAFFPSSKVEIPDPNPRCKNILFQANENVVLTGIVYSRNATADIMADDLALIESKDKKENPSGEEEVYRVFNLGMILQPNQGDDSNWIRIPIPNVMIKNKNAYLIRMTYRGSIVSQRIIGAKNEIKDSHSTGVKFKFYMIENSNEEITLKSSEKQENPLFVGVHYMIQGQDS